MVDADETLKFDKLSRFQSLDRDVLTRVNTRVCANRSKFVDGAN